MLTVRTTRPDPYRGLLAFGVADATLCLGRQSRFRPMAFREQQWGGAKRGSVSDAESKETRWTVAYFFSEHRA